MLVQLLESPDQRRRLVGAGRRSVGRGLRPCPDAPGKRQQQESQKAAKKILEFQPHERFTLITRINTNLQNGPSPFQLRRVPSFAFKFVQIPEISVKPK